MRSLYCFLLLMASSLVSFATHVSGGYIRATPVAGRALTYQITVTMYYDAIAGSGAAQAATSLYVCFGDNSNAEMINRTSVRPFPAEQGRFTVNEYTTTRTYPGAGVYAIQATAINRNSNTRNIKGGASIEQAFSLNTTIWISADRQNQTPVVSLPATGLIVGLNQRAALQLGATDADGDSLTFSLAIPLTSSVSDGATAIRCASFTNDIAGYQFPNDVSQKGTYRLNGRTGLLNWDVPTEEGQYAAAILVSEWRAGGLISQTQHEVIITVADRGGAIVTPPAYEPAQSSSLVTAIPETGASEMVLLVAPNPVTGESAQVEFLAGRSGLTVLELIDSQGRVYETIRLNLPEGRYKHTFDLTGKPAGLYLIRVESGGRQMTRKVLKR
jgi:hypothetical protein